VKRNTTLRSLSISCST